MSEGWERRQQRTRSEVILAAGELIGESGLEGMTMRKLAERAGVAVATLYNQFGDRGGVLVAFVSSGLDRLELELDAQPAVAPIDTTRALLDGFDATFASAPDVWRPIFATLKAGPSAADGTNGMGAVGDRVVQYIANDFAKAAADDMFVVECDTDRLARHVFVSRMSRVEKWAHGVLDWTTYRESSRLGFELILAAVLREPHRSDALAASGLLS